MEKTKIIATIGPSCESKEVLTKLIQNGLDVVRINMSYTNREKCLKIIQLVDDINKELKTFVSIMIDIAGNSITIENLRNEESVIKKGDKIRIYKNKVLGDSTKFSTSFDSFIAETRVGNFILIDNGLIELEVIDKTNDYLLCMRQDCRRGLQCRRGRHS